VQAPKLDQWVSSLPGKQRYVYTKHLMGLQTGVGYRVVVRFRWRAADGTVLRSTTRRSRACRVPDPRPNQVPVSIAAAGGGYVVTVVHRGRSAAPASAVSLDVGDAALGDRDVPALDPGARYQATFAGAPCVPGDMLAATADATGLIDEAVEADDVLTVPCNA
jgi:hypothetical protein